MDLQTFYNNTDLKNNIHEYLVEFCKIQAIDKAFKKEDTNGVGEAKEIIDKAFENLDVIFEPKPKEKVQVNEAR